MVDDQVKIGFQIEGIIYVKVSLDGLFYIFGGGEVSQVGRGWIMKKSDKDLLMNFKLGREKIKFEFRLIFGSYIFFRD